MSFSVLLPIYAGNDPEHLGLALESIRDQTLPPDEILIVEDGPIPDILEALLQKFEQLLPQLRRIRLEQNSGLVDALNEGLKNVRNELVARMDSDDIALPDRFEKQVKFFTDHPDYSLVGGQIKEFIHSPGDIDQVRELPETYEEIVDYSRKRCPFNHPTVMYKRSMMAAVGNYRHFKNFEDYYLWAKIIQSGYKVANLPDIILHFRLGHDFVSRRKGVRYFFREYALLKELKGMGFLTLGQFTRSILWRLPLRVMPAFVVKWVYWYFLRRQRPGVAK